MGKGSSLTGDNHGLLLLHVQELGGDRWVCKDIMSGLYTVNGVDTQTIPKTTALNTD